jgi:hypothetical protein
MTTIFLSPSDLAFLYDESKWGFYQKYNQNIKRPPLNLPKIFTTIDSLIKKQFMGQNLSHIINTLPDADLKYSDQWVKSKPIVSDEFPDIEIIIRGKIDSCFEYADGTCAVIDFKTSEVNVDHLAKYQRQLNCYAYAIENPNSNKDFSVKMSNKCGLLVYEPNEFTIDENETAELKGKFSWVEFSYSKTIFEDFMKNEVIPLIAGKEPKPTAEDPYWVYLQQLGIVFEEE